MKIKKAVFVISDVIIVIVLTLLAIVGFSTRTVESVSVMEPIYRGKEDSKKVSLMINVYWGTEYLEPMLDVFKRYEVTTTFFVGGCWADDNNALLKTIINNGHEIGNHGYFHKDHSALSYQKNVDEIINCHKLVNAVTGVTMTLFAPPSGAVGKETYKACADNNYKVILWSRDTIDWRDKNKDIIVKRATENIKGGELVLMHPTKDTLLALPEILENIKKTGLTVTTVSDVLG